MPSHLAAAGTLVALAAHGAAMGIQTTWAILAVAFASYPLGGFGPGVKNVLLRTLLTARVPDRLHGSAFAAYNAARNTAELAAVGAGGVLGGDLRPATSAGIASRGGPCFSGLSRIGVGTSRRSPMICSVAFARESDSGARWQLPAGEEALGSRQLR